MNIDLMVSLIPKYLSAAYITIYLTIFALLIGIAGGLIMASLKLSKIKILNAFASVYISVIRGTPLLLQIIFVYYSLPAFGLTLQPLHAGILAFGMNQIAYMAETIRGGILAVDKGQGEAARSLGFTPLQTMFVITLPQTIKIILPQLGNMSVALVKDTSLVSTISIAELMRCAQTSYATTFKPLETYLLAGIIYYILSYFVGLIFTMLESRARVY